MQIVGFIAVWVFILVIVLCLRSAGIPHSSQRGGYGEVTPPQFFSVDSGIEKSLATVDAPHKSANREQQAALLKMNIFSSEPVEGADEPVRFHCLMSRDHSCAFTSKVMNPLAKIQKSDGLATYLVEISTGGAALGSGWYKLFHMGNRDSTVRSPGIFINNGQLVVTVSTGQQWNKEVFRSKKPLGRNGRYLVAVELSKAKVVVWFDGRDQVINLVDGLSTFPDAAWIGRHPREQKTHNETIRVTVYALTGHIVSGAFHRSKTADEYIANHGLIYGTNSDGVFDMNYDNYDTRVLSSLQKGGTC